MQTGDEYFDSKEFRDILTSYEESVRSGLPIFMDADDLTDIADYYNYTGDTDRANEVIDFALNMNPGATTPLVFKARAALENENIALARTCRKNHRQRRSRLQISQGGNTDCPK